MGSSKQQEIRKTKKNNNQNASTIKTCKKTLSGRGQTSEIDDGYTLFTVFSEAQGSHKTPEMGAKMPPHTQNHNKSRKASTQKNTKNTALHTMGIDLC